MMMALSQGLKLTLLFNLAIYVASEVYYIKPTTEYQCSINMQPCLTLDEFVVNTSRNLNANTSLDSEVYVNLLPGNHTLSRNLSIWSIKSVQVSSQTNSSWIICQGPNKEFQFLHVKTIEIRNLKFMGCTGCKSFYVGKLSVENCVFLQSELSHAEIGVIQAMNSTIEITYCSFIGTYRGSALYLSHSEISSSHSVYNNNTGSLILLNSGTTAALDNCTFQNNTAVQFALVISNASTIVIHDSLWKHNTFQMPNHDPNRKYEYMIFCLLGCVITITETAIAHNVQTYAAHGGVLMASYSDISFHNCTIKSNFGQNYLFWIGFCNVSIVNATILQNTAVNGDFLFLGSSNVTEFQELNVGENRGNFRLLRSKTNFYGRIKYFNNNGSIIALNSLVNFYDNNLFSKCTHILSGDSGGIVTSRDSTLHFYGTTYFFYNHSPNKGGAIFAVNSNIFIYHKVDNVAHNSGGGIYLYHSKFYCYFNCTFFQNYAEDMGGAIHAVSSKIIADVELIAENQKRYISLAKNRARLGGAVNFEQKSKLSLVDGGLNSQFKMEFAENSANYGGAVYINDESLVCTSKYFAKHTEQTECFLLAYKSDEVQKLITFSENLANIAGSAIFGGLLDRCTISSGFTEDFFDSGVQQQAYGLSFLIGLSNLQPAEIASHPVRVCYCYNSLPDCNYDIPSKSVVLQRGKKLVLPLVAVDQVNHTINATIYSVASSVRVVESARQLHDIKNVCTNLSIRVFPESNQVALYAIGPCNGTGISQRVIKIRFLDCICPIGFSASDNRDTCECVCDPKLPSVVKACTTQTSSILREGNFWIGYVNSMISSGYLFYPNCPFGYCRSVTPPVSINFNTLTGTDAQCAPHRTGFLCGQCQLKLVSVSPLVGQLVYSLSKSVAWIINS